MTLDEALLRLIGGDHPCLQEAIGEEVATLALRQVSADIASS